MLLSGDDHERQVIARASTTASSSVGRRLALHERLVGREDGGARSRHRWRRWVSLELRAGFLSALRTVSPSMSSRWPDRFE